MSRSTSMSRAILAAVALLALASTAQAQTSRTHTPAAPTSAAAPDAAVPGVTHIKTYKKEGEAQTACTGDTVVWGNTATHVYHMAGSAYYGKTNRGGYMCQKMADANGYHAEKNGR